MPVGTAFDIKEGVIYEWLAGTARDKIAEIYNISTGGVTNIVNEWQIGLGKLIADDLRQLSVSLKKINDGETLTAEDKAILEIYESALSMSEAELVAKVTPEL